MAYYLGTSDGTWVEIDAFNFDLNSPASGDKGGVTQPGPAEFSPVRVQLSSDALQPEIIDRMLTGSFDNYFIRVTQNIVGGEQVIADLRLVDAVVTELGDTSEGGPGVALSYGQIALNIYDATDLNNRPFDWDVANNNTKASGIPAALPTFTAPNEGRPAKFVMAIDGVGGSSDVAGHAGWFDVSFFNFGFSNSVSFTGSSKTAGSPQSNGFSVEVSDQTSLTTLLAMAANGSLIDSIEIEGLSAADELMSEMRFGNLQVVQIAETTGNGYSVQFSYQQISVTQFDTKGGQTFNTYDFGTPNPEGGFTNSGDPLTSPVPGVANDTDAPVRYFLALGGVTGDSVQTGHQRWFDINDMDFGLAGGEGIIPQMTSVSVTLASDSQIGQLTQLMTNGKLLDRATVRGVDGNGNVVYTLDLGQVAVGSVTDFGGPGYEIDLNFKQIELTTNGLDSSNKLVTNPHFGWNFETNAPLTGLSSAAPGGKTPASIVAPEKFYMIVQGMNGGSTGVGHERWFELDGVSFNGFKDGATPDFSLVDVDLGSDAGLTAMLRASTLGTTLRGVRIEGVTEVGGIEKKVYSLALQDVVIGNVFDSDGGFSVGLDYQKFALRTFDAITGVQTSVGGWDRIADTSFNQSIDLKTSTGFAEAQANTFLFGMEGIAARSEIKGFEKFSRIDSYSFSVEQPSNEGVKQGASQIGRLELVFSGDVGLETFLAAATVANTFSGASLVGLQNKVFDSGLRQVFSLDLADILVTSVTDFAGAGFRVELDFAKYEIEQRRIDPVTGTLGSQNSFGWDDINDIITIVTNNPGGSGGQIPNASTFYMAIDGIKGDLTGAERGGWLKIGDMSFTGINDGDASSAGGVAAGEGSP